MDFKKCAIGAGIVLGTTYVIGVIANGVQCYLDKKKEAEEFERRMKREEAKSEEFMNEMKRNADLMQDMENTLIEKALQRRIEETFKQ